MKKIICSIVIIAILTSLFSTVSFAGTDKGNMDEEIGLLQKLEILGGELPPLEQKVTRGEFVTLLAKFLKVDTSTHSPDRYYVDISEDSELWNITAPLVNYVLTVPQDRRFRPDDIIKRSEAACAIMKAYGAGAWEYETYTEIAERMDLLDGVSLVELTYKDVITILYNAFTGYPLTYAGDGMGPGKATFMDIYYDMFYVRGVVNAVNKTVLDGNGLGKEGTIRVGNMVMECNIENPYSYLGHDVGVFYTSEDAPEVFYIHSYMNDDDILELNEHNEPVFDASDYTLKYYNEKDKLKEIELPLNVDVIYNGKNMTSNVSGAFGAFEVGKITVLSTKEKNDTVIIESYYDIPVMMTSVEEQIIYGKSGATLSIDSGDRFVSITDANGNPISPELIAPDSIISVYESDVYLKVIVSNLPVTGSITAIQNDDGEKITIGGVTYEITPGSSFTYSLGEYVTAHLNHAGYISYISTERKDGMKYGWVTRYYMPDYIDEDGEEGITLKIFKEDGNFAKYTLVGKARIDGYKRETPDLQVYGMEQGNSGVIDQLILYKVNSDGLITEIDTVAPNAYGTGLMKEFSSTAGTYGSSSVGKLIWATTSTKVFVLPSEENKNKEDAYAIATKSVLEAWGTNDVESYRYTELNKPAAAEVLVLRKDMYTFAKEQRGAFVVADVKHIWNQDTEEHEDVVTLMSGSATKEYILSESFTQHSALNKGNIVTIGLNGKNELSSVTLHYGTDTTGTEVKIMKEIGTWEDATHYIAIGKVVAVGDEYADISIESDGTPTVRFPISTTNIGVFEVSNKKPCKVGTKGDISESMMRGDIVALSMYRGTLVSIAIVNN